MESDPDERSDHVVAGEYVLRTLPDDERRAFERRLAVEGDLRSAVAAWERRLDGLAERLPTESPPESAWRAVQAAISPAIVEDTAPRAVPRAASFWNSIAFWRFGAVGGVLAAAALAVVVVTGANRPSLDAGDGPEEIVWVLTDARKRPSFVVRFEPERRRVTVVPLEVPREAGKDLQLWLVPAGGGAPPRSLGLLQPASVTTLPVDEGALGGPVRSGTLAVSVEPPGGSTTGAPTGPVILQGQPSLVPYNP